MSRLLTKLREAIKDECVSRPFSLGGRGTCTQIDEAEFGHVQKAHKGRPSTVMLDVWGAIDQNTGALVLRPFQKLGEDGSRRFGPAKVEEVPPLVTRFVKTGGWIYSDKLRAYRSNLSALGYKHFALNHSSNPPEFVHPSCPEVHTQTIESVWSDMKTHFRAMHGVGHDSVELHLFEFLWRRNLSAFNKNPFHDILLVLGSSSKHD